MTIDVSKCDAGSHNMKQWDLWGLKLVRLNRGLKELINKQTSLPNFTGKPDGICREMKSFSCAKWELLSACRNTEYASRVWHDVA